MDTTNAQDFAPGAHEINPQEELLGGFFDSAMKSLRKRGRNAARKISSSYKSAAKEFKKRARSGYNYSAKKLGVRRKLLQDESEMYPPTYEPSYDGKWAVQVDFVSEVKEDNEGEFNPGDLESNSDDDTSAGEK